jgi:peptidoglycan/LPS O-acetylase OafA/YrhL
LYNSLDNWFAIPFQMSFTCIERPGVLTMSDNLTALLDLTPSIVKDLPPAGNLPEVAAKPLRPHLNALTGIRFYAALLILLFHTMGGFGLDHKHVIFNNIQVPQTVSMFFVLSGFILTFAHPTLSTFAQFKMFMSMRMSRILPTHAICVLASLILFCVLLKDPFYLDRTIAQSFLLHSLIPMKEYFFHLNLVTWSISTEFIFYLCFPFLLAASRRHLALPLIFAGVSTLCAIILSCALYNPADATGLWYGIIQINPFSRIFEFAVGIVAAQLFIGNKGFLVSESKIVSALYELVAVAAIYASLVILPAMYSSISFVAVPPPVMFYLHGCGGVFIYAFVILVLARGRGFFSAFLGHPVNVWLGEISFALYMTHILLFCSFWRFGLLNQGYPRVAFYVLYLVLALGIAALMHHTVEMPCREWLRAYFKSKKQAQSLGQNRLI